MVIENLGIGIDIVEVRRFKKITYSKNKSFYEKTFLPSEIKYCLKYKDQARHFAGKFAVKESVKKSITENIHFLDIETSHSNSKPIVKLKGKKKYRFLVSISHEDKIAVSVVISERI